MKWLRREEDSLKQLHKRMTIYSGTAVICSDNPRHWRSLTLQRCSKDTYMIEMEHATYKNREAFIRVLTDTFDEMYQLAQEYIREQNV